MSSRDKLIEAAITLFSERGYEGTSVTDLVEQSQVNVSLISYHFGGKRGLLEAVLNTVAHDKLVQANRFLCKSDTITEFKVRIENFLEELCLFFTEQAPLIKLFLSELEQGSEDAEKGFNVAYSDLITSFEKFLKDAQGMGFVRKTPNARILLVQVIGPLSALATSRNATTKYLDVSLDNSTFRKSLIESLITGILDE